MKIAVRILCLLYILFVFSKGRFVRSAFRQAFSYLAEVRCTGGLTSSHLADVHAQMNMPATVTIYEYLDRFFPPAPALSGFYRKQYGEYKQNPQLRNT